MTGGGLVLARRRRALNAEKQSPSSMRRGSGCTPRRSASTEFTGPIERVRWPAPQVPLVPFNHRDAGTRDLCHCE